MELNVVILIIVTNIANHLIITNLYKSNNGSKLNAVQNTFVVYNIAMHRNSFITACIFRSHNQHTCCSL